MYQEQQHLPSLLFSSCDEAYNSSCTYPACPFNVARRGVPAAAAPPTLGTYPGIPPQQYASGDEVYQERHPVSLPLSSRDEAYNSDEAFQSIVA